MAMRPVQVSLLVGNYALKLFDFVKQKDAEQGWSNKLTAQIKEGKAYIRSVHRRNLLHPLTLSYTVQGPACRP